MKKGKGNMDREFLMEEGNGFNSDLNQITGKGTNHSAVGCILFRFLKKLKFRIDITESY